MSDATPRLGLPWLMPAQAQKHVTVNESLGRLDALIQCAVESRSASGQPASPGDGQAFILPAGASGADWDGYAENDIAYHQDGAWRRIAARPGLTAYILDEGAPVMFDGTSWVAFSEAITVLSDLERLGVGTAADAANPFAAKLNTALWTARYAGEGGTGDLRYTFNKEGPADVLSLLFQSGWSGRAELGLTGDDDFTLSVSADGAAFLPALRVDHQTGFVALSGQMNPEAALHVSGSVRADKDGPNPGVIVNRTDSGKAAVLGAGVNASYFMFDDSGRFNIAAQANAEVISGMAQGKRDLITLDGAEGYLAVGPALGAERLHVQDGGSILAESPALARSALHILEEELTGLSGASADTTISCPAGALLLAASVRVTSAVTGASGFDLGVAGDPARFASGLATGAGTAHAGPAAPQPAYAATPVRLTAAGSNFTGGSVRVAIHYLAFDPPQS